MKKGGILVRKFWQNEVTTLFRAFYDVHNKVGHAFCNKNDEAMAPNLLNNAKRLKHLLFSQSRRKVLETSFDMSFSFYKYY